MFKQRCSTLSEHLRTRTVINGKRELVLGLMNQLLDNFQLIPLQKYFRYSAHKVVPLLSRRCCFEAKLV